MSLCKQMANIGSEVERALNWQERNNVEYSQKAFDRALDLIGITMSGLTGESILCISHTLLANPINPLIFY